MIKDSFILILILNILFIHNIYGDDDIEYWGDDYFETSIDTLGNIIAPKEPALLFDIGFFPKPYMGNTLFWTIDFSGWNYNSGSLFLRNYDNYKNMIFNAQPPISEGKLNEATIEKKSFSDKDENFSNADSSYIAGFRYEIAVPSIHTILYGDLHYSSRYYRAFSDKRNQYYLDYSGNKSSFNEISILTIADKSINLGIGLKHPLYGYFVQMSGVDDNMFYYITYGVGMEITLQDKLTVQDYIISESDNIRFISGNISNTHINKNKIDIFNPIRCYYNVGIGWQNSNLYHFELMYRGTFSPLAKNDSYKQGLLYFTIGVDARIFQLLWYAIKWAF
jgi:hypothetical protein